MGHGRRIVFGRRRIENDRRQPFGDGIGLDRFQVFRRGCRRIDLIGQGRISADRFGHRCRRARHGHHGQNILGHRRQRCHNKGFGRQGRRRRWRRTHRQAQFRGIVFGFRTLTAVPGKETVGVGRVGQDADGDGRGSIEQLLLQPAQGVVVQRPLIGRLHAQFVRRQGRKGDGSRCAVGRQKIGLGHLFQGTLGQQLDRPAGVNPGIEAVVAQTGQAQRCIANGCAPGHAAQVEPGRGNIGLPLKLAGVEEGVPQVIPAIVLTGPPARLTGPGANGQLLIFKDRREGGRHGCIRGRSIV